MTKTKPTEAQLKRRLTKVLEGARSLLPPWRDVKHYFVDRRLA